MEELTSTFRFNDAVIHNLVIRRDEPVTEESFIMKAEKENRERKSRYEERQAADAVRSEAASKEKAEAEKVVADADTDADADADADADKETVEE
jgi:small subunit ribosomal protein S6